MEGRENVEGAPERGWEASSPASNMSQTFERLNIEIFALRERVFHIETYVRWLTCGVTATGILSVMLVGILVGVGIVSALRFRVLCEVRGESVTSAFIRMPSPVGTIQLSLFPFSTSPPTSISNSPLPASGGG